MLLLYLLKRISQLTTGITIGSVNHVAPAEARLLQQLLHHPQSLKLQHPLSLHLLHLLLPPPLLLQLLLQLPCASAALALGDPQGSPVCGQGSAAEDCDTACEACETMNGVRYASMHDPLISLLQLSAGDANDKY